MEKSSADMLWVVVASALVFIMQAGFAMVESGLTRSKNSINVAVKNLTDFGVSLVFFWLIGFGVMFGPSFWGLIGTGQFVFNAETMWPSVFILFQAMFCSTAATIVSGAVAERMRFGSYIISTLALSVVVYPVFGHWAWGGALTGEVSGWLGKMGFVDFAGSTVVHSVGGWVSLAVLLIIGPRYGRFGPGGKVHAINGSSVPMAVLGVLLLWFGWVGFNGGSTLSASDAVPGIVLRTMLAGGAGLVGALLIGWPLYRKPEVGLVLNGALAGLVAITANCHAVTETEAVLIGLVGGGVMILAGEALKRLKIDDAVDAIPVHLAAGMWGTLAVGLFGDPAILNTGLDWGGQVLVQGLGILVCGVWCLGISLPGLWLLNKLVPLRISLAHEKEGLNKSEHGVTTEIHDLFTVMDTQAKTGDIALRAPVEPFTEVGQIADMYNSVLERLQGSTVEKGEYLNILLHVSDGLFLLDRDRKISPYYSASLEKLFKTADLAGKGSAEVFSAFLDEKIRAVVQEFFDVVFDSEIPWRHVEKLNPLKEVEAYFDDRQGGFDVRRLEFQFTRIQKDGMVDRVLVLVRDVTDRKELADAIEKAKSESRQELEMLHRILHVEPGTLSTFLDGVREYVEAINEDLRSGGGDHHTRLQSMFRHSHAIKGDAELLNLDFLSEQAEALEVRIQDLSRKDSVSAEDFLPLAISCSSLLSTLEKLDSIVGKWLRLSESVRDHVRGSGSGFGEAVNHMAERLAGRYGKEVRVYLEGETVDLAAPGREREIKEIVIQLVRNAVYHGIEAKEERVKRGKPGAGTIHISTGRKNGEVHIRLRDDGAGLDVERIRKKAVESGIVGEVQAALLNEREVCGLIFHPGFSTADRPDRVAGKGVGLSLVKLRVKQLDGKIHVRTRRWAYSEFSIILPEHAGSATDNGGAEHSGATDPTREEVPV